MVARQLLIDTEIFYSGAVGGGTSYRLRITAILWCAAITGLQVYLFYRIRGDLVDIHVEGPSGFRSLLADWVELGSEQQKGPVCMSGALVSFELSR
ncbi:hypothetical protein [Rhizobium sp. CG4]|uniref:hypothetical protein n=1 Tax=Rhizobium sp. CG4 TaxID=2726075 RepID=UPI0020347A95|nr:hypothetical protein [Rhizobium sp. CG4]